jgi:tryptophan-rich sensory protein
MRGIASKGQLRMSFLRFALVTVPALVLLGSLSGRLANSGYGNPWFDALEKPGFMPPGWLFGVAWTLLYILMGLVLAMILHARGARGRRLVLILFAVQMALNYLWSPLFFAWHQTVAALIVILAMIGLSAAVAALLWWIRKPAALLMLPYLAWLCFAAGLTFEIIRLNPDAAELVPGGSSSDIIDETKL